MITLKKIRELDLLAPAEALRPLHLSAASGLVCVNLFIYVVADDDLHLGVFHAAGNKPGHLIRLFDGDLPVTKAERKKLKPDLEALVKLPAYGSYPHGALLALGSGSKRNRRMGALIELDAEGAVRGKPRPVDLSPILAPLDDAFAELNIEGAAVNGHELCLFQRGTKQHNQNAIVKYPLSVVVDTLNVAPDGAINPSAVHPVDLGQIDGVPLCFTDAAVLPDGDMIFTAVAEDTDDTYNDGPCTAAAIGKVSGDGELHWLRRLDRPYKVEGVNASVVGDSVQLLLVTDADDAAIPAGLFTAATER